MRCPPGAVGWPVDPPPPTGMRWGGGAQPHNHRLCPCKCTTWACFILRQKNYQNHFKRVDWLILLVNIHVINSSAFHNLYV